MTTNFAPRLTADDLARIWNRPAGWIRANAARFGGFKVGGQWRFDPDDIARYEARHKAVDPMSMTDLSAQRQAS